MASAAAHLSRALLACATAVLLAGWAGAPTGSATAAPGAAPGAEQHTTASLEAAEHTLVVRCLARRGLTLTHRPRTHAEEDRLQTALFGGGPRELSVTLATGATVTAHSDGCLAVARQTLYGDQRTWFRAQVTVDNLRAEAAARASKNPAFQAALARWRKCADLNGTPGTPAPAVRPAASVVARCDRSSGLAAVRERLTDQELTHVRALHAHDLTTYQRLRARALRRAAALSTPPTPQKGTTTS
ncbi:hypothetical protein ABZ865_41830 [Streptomyces sp. NPDC047085]|uniref:hypothetical protein n=1 Tax=Streptomyces sp. NPDC047085 TaxID=3155140 RepID=UPI0033E32192